MTFSEIIEQLRSFDEEPRGGRAPAMYVADPWDCKSESIVEWSDDDGGIPLHRKPLLSYLTKVREALQFFGPDYDDRVENGESTAMCAKLAYHVIQRSEQRFKR